MHGCGHISATHVYIACAAAKSASGPNVRALLVTACPPPTASLFRAISHHLLQGGLGARQVAVIDGELKGAALLVEPLVFGQLFALLLQLRQLLIQLVDLTPQSHSRDGIYKPCLPHMIRVAF